MMHRLIGLLYCFGYCASCIAQDIEWQQTIGGTGGDGVISIVQTTDGGFMLAGVSSSGISGDKTEDLIGGLDFWIVKVDMTGNIQWQNTIGGDSTDELTCCIQTSDGGYLLGGYSLSGISGDKSEDMLGEFDYWVVKVDSLGNVQWENTIGGDDRDMLHSVAEAAGGGYLLGGWSRSGISGDKTENPRGDSDFWIVKLDVSGNIQWQKIIGGNYGDFLFSVSQTFDGGYILGGRSDSNISFDKTENTNGWIDCWIVKIDSTGNIQWQNTIGGNSNDYLFSVIQTSDRGYLVGCESWSGISGDKSENSLGGGDFWIVKLDTSGSIEWQNTIGGATTDGSVTVSQTTDGGYILGGHTASPLSGDKTEENQGWEDFWIVKVDAYGRIQWQNDIGGNSFDWFYDVIQVSDGGYLVGDLSLSGISGDKTEDPVGDADMWIFKLSGKYNLIQGKSFADMNANGISDTSEISLPYKKVTETGSGQFTFTGMDGWYSLVVSDTGSFQVLADPVTYFNLSPSVHDASFSSFLQTDSLNNFGYQPAGIYNDLCIGINPLGQFTNGFTAYYQISYSNQGTTTLNPTIIFYPDSGISYISASLLPSSVTADSVIFSLSSLNPFQGGQFMITVYVDPGMLNGSLINSHVAILPVAGDANPGCNVAYWEVFTTGSYDPNDILVSRQTVTDAELLNPPWIEYLIRFQNTGNDTAFYVNIDNRIPASLQLHELEMTHTSHPCSISFQPYDSVMKFTFYNIQLPDSNVNAPMSHGFVRYRIRPQPWLVAGDDILNNARIWFDYNPPVETNTAVTEIVAPVSQPEFNLGSMTVFPNPAFNTLTVTLPGWLKHPVNLELYNCYGQRIHVHAPESGYAGNTIQFDVSGLPAGMYVIRESGTGCTFWRFVKI